VQFITKEGDHAVLRGLFRLADGGSGLTSVPPSGHPWPGQRA
jgi:hypothetical protein